MAVEEDVQVPPAAQAAPPAPPATGATAPNASQAQAACPPSAHMPQQQVAAAPAPGLVQQSPATVAQVLAQVSMAPAPPAPPAASAGEAAQQPSAMATVLSAVSAAAAGVGARALQLPQSFAHGVPAYAPAAALSAVAAAHAAVAAGQAPRMLYPNLTQQQLQQLTPPQQQQYQAQLQRQLQAHQQHFAAHQAALAARAVAQGQQSNAAGALQQTHQPPPPPHQQIAGIQQVGAAAAGGITQPGLAAQHPVSQQPTPQQTVPPNLNKMPTQGKQDKGQELSTPGDGALRDALAAAALKASLAARASKHIAQHQGSSSAQSQGHLVGVSGDQQNRAKMPRAPPAMLQPPSATIAKFISMEPQMPLKQEEAVAGMVALESIKGIPVFAAEGDGRSEGRKPSEFGADTKLTWGKLMYKGNGCNFSVGCQVSLRSRVRSSVGCDYHAAPRGAPSNAGALCGAKAFERGGSNPRRGVQPPMLFAPRHGSAHCTGAVHCCETARPHLVCPWVESAQSRRLAHTSRRRERQKCCELHLMRTCLLLPPASPLSPSSPPSPCSDTRRHTEVGAHAVSQASK